MNTKHTPGPWKRAGLAVYANSVRLAFGSAPIREYLCPVCTMEVVECGNDPEFLTANISGGFTMARLPGDAEAEANARLIAEAPQLLDALEAIVARINGDWENPSLLAHGVTMTVASRDVLRIAESAIAKAKGCTP